jgi:hypothetical protein
MAVMSEKISIDVDGKRISGRYVVKDGMVTVTASDGRTTRAVIEDSMLSPETLAKTLLLQLHRNGADDKRGATHVAANVAKLPRELAKKS